MKKTVLTLAAVVAAGLLVATGCQKSTTEGPGGKSLTITKPSDQTIRAGKSDDVKVSITRKGFEDPVTVTFDNLPKGVTPVDETATIKAGESSGTFRFNAAPDAKPDQKEVSVTAKGGGLSATEKFTMKVEGQKSKD
jgi:hypothetical protein